ncbi:porin family protein [Belliella kenyensis]|uniref:Porin family protein n=1 Tax=Belliella kenyensis TaxID=1472724 RepID=A0ABV8EMR2_9BACT|nr:porin family protein [Belliella kenyensis]MCH7403742.1 PorT family protein [Belliella kenyensis]MDN3602469.1 porin family protein [Belliella kenyensis]
MKNIFLFIFVIVAFKVSGQNHYIGVKGGVSSTNIASTNIFSDSNARLGLTAGLTYEYLSNKYLSFGADLIYNQRGFTIETPFTDSQANLTGDSYTSIFEYDYVSVPIKVGFNIGTVLYGFANIGIVPSLLLDAKHTVPIYFEEGEFVENKTLDVTDTVSKFDFAGLAEMGGGYKISMRTSLFTSLSYQHSFTSITNSSYFANNNIRHIGINFITGLKFAL